MDGWMDGWMEMTMTMMTYEDYEADEQMQGHQSHSGPEVDIEEFAKLVKQPNMVSLSHITGVSLCVFCAIPGSFRKALHEADIDVTALINEAVGGSQISKFQGTKIPC